MDLDDLRANLDGLVEPEPLTGAELAAVKLRGTHRRRVARARRATATVVAVGLVAVVLAAIGSGGNSVGVRTIVEPTTRGTVPSPTTDAGRSRTTSNRTKTATATTTTAKASTTTTVKPTTTTASAPPATSPTPPTTAARNSAGPPLVVGTQHDGVLLIGARGGPAIDNPGGAVGTPYRLLDGRVLYPDSNGNLVAAGPRSRTTVLAQGTNYNALVGHAVVGGHDAFIIDSGCG